MLSQQPPGKTIGNLVAALADPDRFRRSVAIQQLVNAGSAAAPTWPFVLALREDPCWAVRLEVVRGTCCFGVSDQEAVPLLQQLMRDEDALVRSYAKWALENRSAGATAKSEGTLLEGELGWWGPSWNTSRDDPWWRDWLTSRELFTTYHDAAPRLGTRIHSVLGGDVFELGRGGGCCVQVWVAPDQVVVAYPSFGERHGVPCGEEGLHEFEGWINHLRDSEPLELGKARGRSSYGARCLGGSSSPEVKWAQCGDWAALARTWHLAD